MKESNISRICKGIIVYKSKSSRNGRLRIPEARRNAIIHIGRIHWKTTTKICFPVTKYLLKYISTYYKEVNKKKGIK